MDVNAVSSDGTSSGLAEAARSNSVEVVEWLRSLEDTDVNIRTLRIDCDPYHCAEWMELPWWTPLMYACEAGHGDIVRMLREPVKKKVENSTLRGGGFGQGHFPPFYFQKKKLSGV